MSTTATTTPLVNNNDSLNNHTLTTNSIGNLPQQPQQIPPSSKPTAMSTVIASFPTPSVVQQQQQQPPQPQQISAPAPPPSQQQQQQIPSSASSPPSTMNPMIQSSATFKISKGMTSVSLLNRDEFHKYSCTRCRRLKKKCSRQKPTCYNCQRANEDCQYVDRKNKRSFNITEITMPNSNGTTTTTTTMNTLNSLNNNNNGNLSTNSLSNESSAATTPIHPSSSLTTKGIDALNIRSNTATESLSPSPSSDKLNGNLPSTPPSHIKQQQHQPVPAPQQPVPPTTQQQNKRQKKSSNSASNRKNSKLSKASNQESQQQQQKQTNLPIKQENQNPLSKLSTLTAAAVVTHSELLNSSSSNSSSPSSSNLAAGSVNHEKNNKSIKSLMYNLTADESDAANCLYSLQMTNSSNGDSTTPININTPINNTPPPSQTSATQIDQQNNQHGQQIHPLQQPPIHQQQPSTTPQQQQQHLHPQQQQQHPLAQQQQIPPHLNPQIHYPYHHPPPPQQQQQSQQQASQYNYITPSYNTFIPPSLNQHYSNLSSNGSVVSNDIMSTQNSTTTNTATVTNSQPSSFTSDQHLLPVNLSINGSNGLNHSVYQSLLGLKYPKTQQSNTDNLKSFSIDTNLANKFIECYFEENQRMYPFINKNDFLNDQNLKLLLIVNFNIDEFKRNIKDQDSSIDNLIFQSLLILSIGCINCNKKTLNEINDYGNGSNNNNNSDTKNQSENRSTSSSDNTVDNSNIAIDSAVIFNKAMEYLDIVMNLPNNQLNITKSLLLLSIYSFFNNDSEKSWFIIGTLTRLSISIGLNRSLKINSINLSKFELEMKYRLFWSVYNIDRLISITVGKPFSINDDDINIPLPSPLSDDEIDPITLTNNIIQLRRIEGLILKHIYCVRASSIYPSEQSKEEIFSALRKEVEMWYVNTLNITTKITNKKDANGSEIKSQSDNANSNSPIHTIAAVATAAAADQTIASVEDTASNGTSKVKEEISENDDRNIGSYLLSLASGGVVNNSSTQPEQAKPNSPSTISKPSGVYNHDSTSWLSARYYHMLMLLYMPSHLYPNPPFYNLEFLGKSCLQNLSFTYNLFVANKLPMNFITVYRILIMCAIILNCIIKSAIDLIESKTHLHLCIDMLEKFGKSWEFAKICSDIFKKINDKILDISLGVISKEKIVELLKHLVSYSNEFLTVLNKNNIDIWYDQIFDFNDNDPNVIRNNEISNEDIINLERQLQYRRN
ncbi:binding protein [[Candida] boidinii]|nr:binding protein [[Candida] boidinii]OWB62904.1 binding protein [[Candida] boidinii]